MLFEMRAGLALEHPFVLWLIVPLVPPNSLGAERLICGLHRMMACLHQKLIGRAFVFYVFILLYPCGKASIMMIWWPTSTPFRVLCLSLCGLRGAEHIFETMFDLVVEFPCLGTHLSEA